MTDKSTDLMVPDNNRLIAAFSDSKKVDGILSAISDEVKSFVPDLTTAKSRKEITSLAFKVTRSKTAFDDVGKQINAEGRARLNAVDAERRKIRDTLDGLAKEVKAPLVEWEGKETTRVNAHKARLEQMDISRITAFDTSENLNGILDRITAIQTDDDWEEFRVSAKANRTAAIVTLKGYILTAVRREKDQLELDQLRADKIKRDQKDRDAELERGRKATKDAADKAEKKRKKAEKQALLDAVEQGRKDAAKEAIRLADEAAAKHKRELAEAKQREDKAAQNERDRITREEQRKKDADEHRASNTRRRNKVRKEMVAGIAKILSDEGLSDKDAPYIGGYIADALTAGEIPHVKVVF